MATANITREEAAARSDLVQAKAYRVTVDVTGDGVEDKEHNFLSRTEFDFSSKSGSTHLDIIADEIRSATLDGVALPLEGFDGYRLPLADLTEGDHTVVVEAVGRYSHTGEGLHRFVDPTARCTCTPSSRRRTPDGCTPASSSRTRRPRSSLTVSAPAELDVCSPTPPSVARGPRRATGRPASSSPPPRGCPPTSPRWWRASTTSSRAEITVRERRAAPRRVACRASMAEYLDADGPS